MRDAKTNRRKWIIVSGVSLFCLCLLVLALAMIASGNSDTLARIEDQINRQGHCTIPGAGNLEIVAQSARMENGCLVLHGSSDPNGESCVRVVLWPSMGSERVCSARSVSIQRTFKPEEWLTITFHQPTHLSRAMLGRSLSVPVRKCIWILELRYGIRDLLRSHQSQKPQSPSP